MKRILKWKIPIDEQRHTMGAGKVIHVSPWLPDIVCVWTEEDENVTQIDVQIYATGVSYSTDGEAVGSTVIASRPGPVVWHVVQFRKPLTKKA